MAVLILGRLLVGDEIVDKREYFDSLSCFDWFYEYSDDYAVYKEGITEYGRLFSIGMHNPELKPILEAFDKWRGGMCKGPMPALEDF